MVSYKLVSYKLEGEIEKEPEEESDCVCVGFEKRRETKFRLATH